MINDCKYCRLKVPVTTKCSADDSYVDYTSLDASSDGAGAGARMVEDHVRDTVRLQKLFRKLQRQVHSPEHQVRSSGYLEHSVHALPC